MGTMTNKLYYLDCRVIIQEQVVVASVQNEYDIWHQRPGHLNERQLKEMTNHDLVKGMRVPKSLSLSFCGNCVEEKKPRDPLRQWEKSDQKEDCNECTVMLVDPCLLHQLGEKDISSHLLTTTQDIVKSTL
jgi:hypothetical protein